MWFNNSGDNDLNEIMLGIIKIVPSHVFLPLIYQIASRLGSESSSNVPSMANIFSQALRNLLLKLAHEHPFHTLPPLFLLQNGAEVPPGASGSLFKLNVNQQKAFLARELLRTLRSGTTSPVDVSHTSRAIVCEAIDAMSCLSVAYNALANFDIECYKRKNQREIPLRDVPVNSSSSFVQYLKDAASHFNLQHLTAELSVRENGGYVFRQDGSAEFRSHSIQSAKKCRTVIPISNPTVNDSVVSIAAFDPRFTITETGISRPKIVVCHGNDGRVYKQLVKGGDDMRQDAIMQQLFGIVNIFLRQNVATTKRNLNIKTYKVCFCAEVLVTLL
jgi:ataxia telangiectasia mutated family protein